MVDPLKYRLLIERKAAKEAEKIPTPERQKIDKAIMSLAGNPRPHESKKLTQKEGYRIRVGNYRVLYTVDDVTKTVVVYRIKIRAKDTYR